MVIATGLSQSLVFSREMKDAATANHERAAARGCPGLPRYHTLSSHLLLPYTYTCPWIYRHPMPVLPVTHLELIHPRAVGLGLREAGMWPI